MNTNTVRTVLVYTHPATVAAALVGVCLLALAAVLMVMLAMLTVSVALAYLVGQALADESRTIWRSLTLWGDEQGSTPPRTEERPDPIVVRDEVAPEAIPIPFAIPVEEPAEVLLPDAHIVHPAALEGLASVMEGKEPTPTLQAAELVPTPPVKAKRSRRKVKVETAPSLPKWEDMTTDELVAACKAKGIKANARWKRETLLARLTG